MTPPAPNNSTIRAAKNPEVRHRHDEMLCELTLDDLRELPMRMQLGMDLSALD